MKKWVPIVLFGFILASIFGVRFPAFISRYLFLIVNGIALFALWPAVRSNL